MMGSPSGSLVKNPPAKKILCQETHEMQVWSLGQEDPLEKKMAMTAVFLLGKFCGLQSIGSQRVRHN